MVLDIRLEMWIEDEILPEGHCGVWWGLCSGVCGEMIEHWGWVKIVALGLRLGIT